MVNCLSAKSLVRSHVILMQLRLWIKILMVAPEVLALAAPAPVPAPSLIFSKQTFFETNKS
jgi:hypothetical protein